MSVRGRKRLSVIPNLETHKDEPTNITAQTPRRTPRLQKYGLRTAADDLGNSALATDNSENKENVDFNAQTTPLKRPIMQPLSPILQPTQPYLQTSYNDNAFADSSSDDNASSSGTFCVSHGLYLFPTNF